MDKNQKRAEFLQYLRKRKGLTQQELAELIHYSDKNISKWETGKSYPKDLNVVEQLAEIFEVSFEELVYGEFKNETNKEKITENVKKEYISSYNKYVKTLKYAFVGILIITIIFFILTYYFYIKNSVHYYTGDINYNSEKSRVAVLITNKVNIFNFRKLKDPDEKISLISFYYKDNDKEKLIFTGENDDYYISEKNSYQANNFEELVKETCYLKIKYKDGNEETIPVKFQIDYINDNIFPENTETINTEKRKLTSEDLIKKLEKLGFEFRINEYSKNLTDDIICTFNPRRNKIEILITHNDITENIYSFLNNSKKFYERIEGDNDTVTKTIEVEEIIDCNTKKCETIEDFAKYINYLKYE